LLSKEAGHDCDLFFYLTFVLKVLLFTINTRASNVTVK